MSDLFIKTEKDKTGADVTIKWAQGIGSSPVVPFFLKNYAALIENGHALPYIMWSNKSKAVYAEIDGKVVGHIVYEIHEDLSKTAWIVFSCVDNDYRQRGLYKLIHTSFESIVRKSGSTKIASSVHINNSIRQISCTSVGMAPTFYRMEKQL